MSFSILRCCFRFPGLHVRKSSIFLCICFLFLSLPSCPMSSVGSMCCQAERLHGLRWVRSKVGFSSKPQLDTISPPSFYISPYENTLSNHAGHDLLHLGDRSEAICCHGSSRANDTPNLSLAHGVGIPCFFCPSGDLLPRKCPTSVSAKFGFRRIPLYLQGLHLQESGIAEILSQIRLVRTPSQVYSQKCIFEHRSP